MADFHPQFVQSIKDMLPDEADALIASLCGEAPTSIRTNPFKNDNNQMWLVPDVVKRRVAWSPNGYYLTQRPAFTFDPMLHAGRYYVQEAASMFVEHIVRHLADGQPRICLDLCAAPGGKSIAMLTALPDGSVLVSNEVVRRRAHILAENITKFGHRDVVVCNNSPSDFAALPNFFDMVLVDAPCSGEGMFRKDEEAISEWSPQNVDMCSERQRTIVADVWDSLRPGGFLIYSTCTFNKSENEDNVRWIADRFGASFVSIPVETEWNIASSLTDSVEAYRFFPHLTQGEGFFVSVLQKPDGVDTSARRKTKKTTFAAVKNQSDYAHLLRWPHNFVFAEVAGSDGIVAVSEPLAPMFDAVCSALNTVSVGTEVGRHRGKDFVPSHSLAMSLHLAGDNFVRHPLQYAEAIDYLSGQSLSIVAPKGFVLLTYDDEPLGFAKSVGSRANNLYPQEWRIRGRNQTGNATKILRRNNMP